MPMIIPQRRKYEASCPQILLALALVLASALPAGAFTEKLTDEQIVAQIIQASRAAYYATGHPCACPEDLARNGTRCGGRSAWSCPGGAAPKCYPKDLSPAEINAYRTRLSQ